jgi:hypothetical protein
MWLLPGPPVVAPRHRHQKFAGANQVVSDVSQFPVGAHRRLGQYAAVGRTIVVRAIPNA